MPDVSDLKAYHRLNGKALEIHRQWRDMDAEELLPLAVELKALAESVIAVSGVDWHRLPDLTRHLGYLVGNLGNDQKDKSTSDINDLIYTDLPALAQRLLSQIPA